MILSIHCQEKLNIHLTFHAILSVSSTDEKKFSPCSLVNNMTIEFIIKANEKIVKIKLLYAVILKSPHPLFRAVMVRVSCSFYADFQKKYHSK